MKSSVEVSERLIYSYSPFACMPVSKPATLFHFPCFPLWSSLACSSTPALRSHSSVEGPMAAPTRTVDPIRSIH